MITKQQIHTPIVGEHLDLDKGLLSAIDATLNGVVLVDALQPDYPIVYVNSAFEKMTGYQSSEVVGTNCRMLQGPKTCEEKLKSLKASVYNGRHFQSKILNYRKDGSTFWNDLTISPIHNDYDEVVGFVGIQNDVTFQVLMGQDLEEKIISLQKTKQSLDAANKTLKEIAYTDPLTKLATRRLFDDRLKLSLARSKRSGKPLALAFIDLDDFKRINDTFGHDIGDKALCYVADVINSQIRETDTLARIGGDEYLLLFDTFLRKEDVFEICKRISAKFSKPFVSGDVSLQLSLSIGTAFYPEDGEDAKKLIISADFNMYKNKKLKP